MTENRATTRRYVPAVGPKLKRLLFFIFGLFALLVINSVYLAAITILEWVGEATYQDYFYQYMFLGHLALGLMLIVPVIVYGVIHISNAHDRPNRRAVRVGYALFTTAILLLATGLLLTRGIPLIEVRHPETREVAYWLHVIAPLIVAWLFVLHRLAGKAINWRFGTAIAAFGLVFAGVVGYFQYQDPRQWNTVGPESGVQYFFPSLARTATGDFIPAGSLMMDHYCRECHEDAHRKWSHSAHRLASFNNQAYLFSVRNTREAALARDGDVQASRFCAGCHDPVPFFSGAFDDPGFDDVDHPTAHAGITCTVCHAITHINSPRGNADYTIEEPLHYPFTFSENEFLGWVNRTLVKAKPAFHKKTFLKPLHRSTEFCGTCHKVHLPVELNHYKWLRGQNHYDSFLLSGFSGHGVSSFYYPEQAEGNCNGCHMPWQASVDFGAKVVDGQLMIHDHQFPSANTALAKLEDWPEWVNQAHEEFLRDSLRVDLFGLRHGGTIQGELTAPLRPVVPVLEPGATYLLEVVIRNLSVGHHFTQGTADSNEAWLALTVRNGDRIIGESGAMDPEDGEVDRWAHFVNAYVLDREGNRIDRRNAEDIFIALYDHQIPPGAADVVHYLFRVPESAEGTVEVDVALNYRKFDTTYMRYFQGAAFNGNDLPVTTIASDRIVFPVSQTGEALAGQVNEIAPWQRWNDYGIGLFRKADRGELRQAEHAFGQVARIGRGEGHLNLARVYIREGRLDDAVAALRRAAAHEQAAYPWSVTYFTALVDLQNGFLDEAIEGLRNLVATNFHEARQRGFDFSRDYRLLNQLAQALFERSKLERGDARLASRRALLEEASDWFRKALASDPENTESHYGLAQVYSQLGEDELAEEHRRLHGVYKIDDNARDRTISLARSRDEAADHAANAVVIYDLQRTKVRSATVSLRRALRE